MTQRGLARLFPYNIQRLIFGSDVDVECSVNPLEPNDRNQLSNVAAPSMGAVHPDALLAAARNSHPTSEAAPWAVHALSSLAKRRMLLTASNVLTTCGCANEDSALEVAMAVTMAASVRALVIPRMQQMPAIFRGAATVLNAAAVVAWGAYMLRRGINASLQSVDSVDNRIDTTSRLQPRPRTDLSMTQVIDSARVLVAYYKNRLKRASPLRMLAISVAATAVLYVLLTLRRRRPL